MTESHQTKAELPNTWPVFFARHGSFTPIQSRSIPAILSGQNALIIAPTASGKTEAVIAPLLERHALGEAGRGLGAEPELRILYLCPTRALVRDLYERLQRPLERLGVAVAMKSGDTGPVSVSKPPTLLITTPESTDSLLTRAPRLLASLHAIALDEIHLFDNGPRGDHIRCLLRRIERVRHFHQQQHELDPTPLQRIALSATVPDPEGLAARYLIAEISNSKIERGFGGSSGTARISKKPVNPFFPPDPRSIHRRSHSDPAYTIIQAGEGRRIEAEIRPMIGLADLAMALVLRAGDRLGIRKTLIFCNSRNEVEQTAAFLRGNLPFEAKVFVHYSNLDPAMRRSVEDGFAEASVAVCVSSSTLELGIDIGSVDDVALVGPPPTLTSFLQRIGRGGRRSGRTQVLCLPRSALEEVRFQALLELAQSGQSSADTRNELISDYHFRPSVLVQQIFSILKQSPTGGIRLADVRRVTPVEEQMEHGFDGSGGLTRISKNPHHPPNPPNSRSIAPLLDDNALRRILQNLTMLGYLRRGKLGEWRADRALDELADAHEIYSNIGADPLAITVVDAYSGRTIAQTSRIRLKGDTLLLGGRTLEVVWRDRYRLGVRVGRGQQAEEELRFVTKPFAVPLEIGQAVAGHLGLAANQLPLLHDEGGVWLFHFWGDLYGMLLGAMLQSIYASDEEPFTISHRNEFVLYLPMSLVQLPAWDEALARQELQHLLPRIGPYLETGRFHSLLPTGLANQAAVALCDLPRFERLYRAAMLVTAPAALRDMLRDLL